MKRSFSVFTGIALSAAFALASCSGGGSTTPATPNNAVAQAQTPTSGSVPIGSLDLMHAASSVPVNITSRTPASPTTDVDDRATVTVTMSAADTASGLSGSTQHTFAGTLRGPASSSAHRATKDVALNAPSDVTYQGGTVLGSAVSHNVFVNCDTSCRDADNFNPGKFLSDLGSDAFITLLYQYLQTPGVVDTAPLTSSYTKGKSVFLKDTYVSSPLPGDNAPYYGQGQIAEAVRRAAAEFGGGLGHIYHVFLPKDVETCLEPNFGGTPNGECYSPYHASTFTFCAYHGTFSGNLDRSPTAPFLYTVEPYQDVKGCQNNVHNQALPNAARNSDPADPGYSTLSNELYETITDPLLDAWYNVDGKEIGDLCASFANFVTVSGRPYVLQSEYSDLHHICISGNLTSPAQTPQTSAY